MPFRFSLFQCGLAQLPAAPPNRISQHAVQLVVPPTSGWAVRTHLLRCCLIFLRIYRLSSTAGPIETPSLSGLEGVASTPETLLRQPISQMKNRGGGKTEHTLGLSPTASSVSWGPIWEAVRLGQQPPCELCSSSPHPGGPTHHHQCLY